MTSPRAFLYIRQSRVADADVALSQPVQLANGLALAKTRGVPEDRVTVYTDLGKSGGAGKEKRRPDYQRMLADIEADAPAFLLALSLTRLARSAGELERVALLCERKNITIVTEKEGMFDPTNPISNALFGMVTVFARFERDLAVQRQLDNMAERRKRGERLGPVLYEERPGNVAAKVLELFRETRSLNATAVALNDAGHRTANKKLWNGTVIRNLIERLDPGLLPTRKARGVKPSSPFHLYRLLRCPCGQTMTASRPSRGRTDVYYRCHAADTNKAHPRPYRATEARVLPWIKAEVALLGSPDGDVEALADRDHRLAVLQARRAKLADVYAMGDMARETYLARRDQIDERIAAASSEIRVQRAPDAAEFLRDWAAGDLSTETVNRFLSDAFRYVELGPDMLPVRAEWTTPEWRLAPLAATQTA